MAETFYLRTDTKLGPPSPAFSQLPSRHTCVVGNCQMLKSDIYLDFNITFKTTTTILLRCFYLHFIFEIN